MESSRPSGNIFLRFFHALLGCFCFIPNTSSDDTPCQSTSGTSPQCAKTPTSIGMMPRHSKTSSARESSPRPTKTSSSHGNSPRHTELPTATGQQNTKKSSSRGTSQQHPKTSSSSGRSLHHTRTSFLSGSSLQFSNLSTDYESGCEEEQTGYSMFSAATSMAIERFNFYQELGRGAYGKVVLAQDTVRGDLLAMKMVKKRRYISCPETVMIERRILELAIDCPFLTHARGAFQTQEYLIYAMEFVSGGTLGQFIQRNEYLSISMTQFFSAEIVCGVRFLHRNSIVHRDLKTENILLDCNGHCKIADFGLAVEDVYADDEAIGFAGTAGYTAPEMLQRDYYNSSVDWWALGVIMFEMATGEMPFWGDDCSSLLQEVEELVYPDFFSYEMTDLLQELWTIDPVLRLELARDIRSHPFFDDIKWEDMELKLTAPPVSPDPTYTISRMEDLFRSQGNNVSASEEQNMPLSPQNQELFCGFSFVSPNWS